MTTPDHGAPLDRTALGQAGLDEAVVILSADWILTVDQHDTVLTESAVAVQAGVIIAVGPLAELLKAHPQASRKHLPNSVLMPGMVNAHTHLAMTMFRGLADDRNLQQFLELVMPAEAAVLRAQSVSVATAAAAVESIHAGVTTALDMYFFAQDVVAACDLVGMRVMTGPTFMGSAGPEGMTNAAQLEWTEAWLAANPARPGWRAVVAAHSAYLVSPEELQQVAALAQRHDATFHIHAAESLGEIDSVLAQHGKRTVELLDHLGVLGHRTVLGHAVHVNDYELERIAATRTAVAHCPASNLKLGSGFARVPEMLLANVTVGLGTDGPASSNDLDLFAAMRLAALIHKGVQGDATVLPAAQVVRAATLGGATALGLGDSIGSIEVGKQADLIGVDLSRVHTQPVYDPNSALVYAAGRDDVRHVWVAGKEVLADGVMTRVDEAEVTQSLMSLRLEVLASVGRS
jgi:5-methylthioadenosine/S-adenosylhomocysteine deaminase